MNSRHLDQLPLIEQNMNGQPFHFGRTPKFH